MADLVAVVVAVLSLAAVVVYEPGQQDYKLSATVMGVRVILERDGSKTRDTSESK